MEGSIEGFSLPEWYRLEQESKKAVGRLHEIRELAFYSENPDPFIRRLAIIRADQLGGREAFSMLNSILEDPLETEQNRMLAGSFMYRLSESLGLGYFIQSRFMQMRQDEGEDPGKVLLTVTDSQPAIRYEFSKSLIESQLQMDQSIIKINLDDREFLFPIQFRQWIICLGKSTCKNAIPFLKRAFRKTWPLLCASLRKYFISLPKTLLQSIRAKRSVKRNMTAANGCLATVENDKSLNSREAPIIKGMDPEVEIRNPVEFSKETRKKRIMPVRYKTRRKYGMPFLTRCNFFMRSLLFLILKPFCFVFRHKLVIFGSALAIYLPISLTDPGKAFLLRLNPGFYQANERFIQSMGQFTVKAFQGALFTEPLASVDSPAEKVPAAPPKALQYYVVTAPKGLYLRDKPSQEGGRIKLMKQSTTVQYLEEKTQNEGVTWLKIKLDDGTSGWTNAEWLRGATDG